MWPIGKGGPSGRVDGRHLEGRLLFHTNSRTQEEKPKQPTRADDTGHSRTSERCGVPLSPLPLLAGSALTNSQMDKAMRQLRADRAVRSRPRCGHPGPIRPPGPRHTVCSSAQTGDASTSTAKPDIKQLARMAQISISEEEVSLPAAQTGHTQLDVVCLAVRCVQALQCLYVCRQRIWSLRLRAS